MINIALVGFGLAGKTFHAPLIDATSGLNLSVIVTSREKEVHVLYPQAKVLSQFSDIFKEQIDLVVIATPNEFHFEQAKLALENGKHVVVDKPFTKTIEEALKLRDLAGKNNLILSIFHNRRFDGDFLTIQKLLSEEKLGRIVSFESNFNRFRPEVDKSKWRETTDYAGGLFFDLAPHLIDQALCLFGKPLKILCDLETIRDEAKNDDYFHLIFSYPKMRVHLNASTVTSYVGERFKIHGDKDSYTKFEMDSQEAQLKSGMKANDKDFGQILTSGQLKLGGSISQETGDYKKYYQNIYSVIETNQTLEVSVDDAINVMKLMQACLDSVKRKSWIEI